MREDGLPRSPAAPFREVHLAGVSRCWRPGGETSRPDRSGSRFRSQPTGRATSCHGGRPDVLASLETAAGQGDGTSVHVGTGALSHPRTAGLLSSVAAEGQGRAESSDPDWQPPMTACGHPDFQCKWSNETLTTFEWRPGLGPAYTQEEVDAIEGRERSRLQTDLGPSDPDRAPPPVTGSVGSCNEIYYERRDRVARVNGEPRTSLITFPSDGRIPALSPEGARRKQTYEEFRAQFGEFDHPELRPLAERCIVSSASSPAGVMGPPSCGCNKPGVVVRLPVEMRCIIGRNAAGCGNLGSHSQGTGWRSPGIPVSPLIGRPQLPRESLARPWGRARP